jgi:hypothetical protein
MQAFIVDFDVGPPSQVERYPRFPFLAMDSCTFFWCGVSIHFTAYDSLHFPTLQDCFKPFLTHFNHPSLQFKEQERPPKILHHGLLKGLFQLSALGLIVH